MYPSVNGKTLSVQGDKLVTRPAPKITATLQTKTFTNIEIKK